MSEMYPLFCDILQKNGTVTFTVSGKSMQPMLYNERDSVTLKKPEFPLKKFDIPFYKAEDGHYILHRIIKVHNHGEYYTCRGDNLWNKETPIYPEQIVGVVESFERSGKKRKVTKNPLYFLYTRTWPFFHYFKKYYIYFFKAKETAKKQVQRVKNLISPDFIEINRRGKSVERIIFCPAEKKDISELQNVLDQQGQYEIKEFDNYVLNGTWAKSDNAKQFFERIIEEGYVLLAKKDREIIGYLVGRITDNKADNFKIGTIKYIYINEEFRSFGIGTELINRFKDYCLSKNCNNLSVSFLSKNEKGENFYRKNGFEDFSKTFFSNIKKD